MEMTVTIPNYTEVDVEIEMESFVDAYSGDDDILNHLVERNSTGWVMSELDIETPEITLNDIFNSIDKMSKADRALILWHLLKGD